jgi:hypothetical protein
MSSLPPATTPGWAGSWCDGTKWEGRRVWFERLFANHHGNAVLLDGHLYGDGDGG